MATPPVQVPGGPWQSAWTSAANGARLAPTGASTFAVLTGDLITVHGGTEDTAKTLATPTNAAAASPASITWTSRLALTPASHGNAYIWSGAVTAGGNVQVSSVHAGGTGGSGIIVYAWRSHNGVGRVASGSGTGTVPSVTPTGGAWTANSAVPCVNVDWSAVSHGASRSYLTNLGAATEANYTIIGGYTTETWLHADAGSSPASGAIGLTTPSQTWTIGGLEVLGTAGGGVTVKQLAALGAG